MDSATALAFWRPYANSNLAAPDHRESRSTSIVIMTFVTEGLGGIKRRKRCPFVRLSVCCTSLEPDLCAGHVTVGGGGVLLSLKLRYRVPRKAQRVRFWDVDRVTIHVTRSMKSRSYATSY